MILRCRSYSVQWWELNDESNFQITNERTVKSRSELLRWLGDRCSVPASRWHGKKERRKVRPVDTADLNPRHGLDGSFLLLSTHHAKTQRRPKFYLAHQTSIKIRENHVASVLVTSVLPDWSGRSDPRLLWHRCDLLSTSKCGTRF